MNKIYKSIYNESIGAYVAVSEMTKGCGKRSSASKLAVVSAALVLTSLSGVANAITCERPGTSGSWTCDIPMSNGAIVTISGLAGANELAAEAAASDWLANNPPGGSAVAIGSGDIRAAGSWSVAIGWGAQALGDSSIAIGDNAKAADSHGIALGKEAKAGRATVAIGQDAGAFRDPTTSAYNTYVGDSAGAGDIFSLDPVLPGVENVGVGRNAGRITNGHINTALGAQSGIGVIGDFNYHGGWHSGAYTEGVLNNATGAFAGAFVEGNNNIANGTASGIGIVGDNNVSFGRGAATGVAFEPTTGEMKLRDGTSFYFNTAYQDIPAVEVNDTIAIGNLSYVGANRTIAIGKEAEANAIDSIAIGRKATTDATANETAGVAIGSEAGTCQPPLSHFSTN